MAPRADISIFWIWSIALSVCYDQSKTCKTVENFRIKPQSEKLFLNSTGV